MARTKSSSLSESQKQQQQKVEGVKNNKRKRVEDKPSNKKEVAKDIDAEKPSAHYQFRSNLVSTVSLIKSIKQKITEVHIAELRKTPFWSLLECILDNKLSEQMCRKNDKDIILILDTYNAQRRQFRLGKSYVPLTANDISLIFGIPNGTRVLDLKYSKRKTTEFISRRFHGGSRVSAPQIKQQLLLALDGESDTDIADVARLLCLHLLVGLFFSTYGNTIGWAYVGYVENYMDMKHYAWAEEITKFLMESIHNRSRGSDSVIGCLAALPYWLCEHTTIIKPDDSVHFPRILKWNLRAVSMALRKRPLHSLAATEVLVDELDITLLEVQRLQSLLDSGASDKEVIMGIEGEQHDGQTQKKQGYGGEITEEVEQENVDQGYQGEQMKMIEASQPDTDMLTSTLVVSELEEQQQNSNSEETDFPAVAKQSISFGAEMAGYEQTSQQTDLLVANILADIIASASNTVNEEPSEAHPGSLPEAGDTLPSPSQQSPTPENSEIKTLTEERDRANSLVIQLTNEKTELQEQIQRMAIDLERTSAENNSIKKQRLETEHMITSLVRERDDALLLVEQLTKEKTSLETHIVDKDHTLEESTRMVSSLKEQLKHTINVSEIQSSRATTAENEVKGLKKKMVSLESNNFKLQQLLKEMAIEYTEKGLQWAGKTLDDIFQPTKKNTTQQKAAKEAETELQIMPSVEPLEPIKEVKQSSMVKRIKKRTATRKMNTAKVPFTLPKNAVTKLLDATYVEKLNEIFDAEGSSALVWRGEGMQPVSYENIVAVLSRAELSSTVIDCYAELLYREQSEIQQQLTTVQRTDTLPRDKSCFVTSLCWTIATSSSPEMRDKILHPQISPRRTAEHRFVLFPMNSNGKRKDAEPFHWTLLVLDQKEGDWLHYNSLRPRSPKTVDHYFEDARTLKQYVENYNFVTVEETQPYGAPLISVEDAPQQKMGSVDCGVVVCYLMKQLTHKQVIVSKLPQRVLDGLRAEIVSKFLNDKHCRWSLENFQARQLAADDDFES